jgi:hypothetical protein
MTGKRWLCYSTCASSRWKDFSRIDMAIHSWSGLMSFPFFLFFFSAPLQWPIVCYCDNNGPPFSCIYGLNRRRTRRSTRYFAIRNELITWKRIGSWGGRLGLRNFSRSGRSQRDASLAACLWGNEERSFNVTQLVHALQVKMPIVPCTIISIGFYVKLRCYDAWSPTWAPVLQYCGRTSPRLIRPAKLLLSAT